MIGTKYIRWAYYTGIVGIVAGISLSKPAVSVGLGLCGLAWLAEGNFGPRLRRLAQHPFFWISLALILLHVLGLCWSANTAYGLKDTKTKLPLLILPIVFLGSGVFHIQQEFRFVKAVFISSLVVCTLLSFGVYYGHIKPGQFNCLDMRTMVFGVSGVRLALFICLAICFMVYDVFTAGPVWWRITALALTGWFLYFLNFIESGTGVLFLLVLLLFAVGYVFYVRLRGMVRVVMLVLLVTGSGMVTWVVMHTVADMLALKPDPVTASHSKYGEKYITRKHLMYIENGYMVGRHIARRELKRTWNERSAIRYDSLDKQGQPIFATLIRYLNSKGMAKDRESVEKLTPLDIRNIENGIANYHYTYMGGWKKRLVQVLFELEAYRTGQNPFGNSITQRFEYWRMGVCFFRQNWLYGVGTGDVRDTFDAQYSKLPFKVDDRYRLRAHNQYLTMAITFGIIGFMLFAVYALSILWTGAYRRYTFYALSFFIIMLLSFLSEDTLETQSGVTFIAFFHTLFQAAGAKQRETLHAYARTDG